VQSYFKKTTISRYYYNTKTAVKPVFIGI